MMIILMETITNERRRVLLLVTEWFEGQTHGKKMQRNEMLPAGYPSPPMRSLQPNNTK